MRRSSPDSTSGRSPDSPNCEVHLTPRKAGRDPRRHRFDSTVAAFVAACRAEVLSERTIEFYLEGLNAYRTFAGADRRELTLADVDLGIGRAWRPGSASRRRQHQTGG